ncbi:helix-turn-helix domain-containing protein [Streptomyces sp. ISL-10]|uniref:helix-turn-helix domain-containing protein n=1 Tax=Streptomyces sp. ISL-10 TaxID=2819172 RepID=UPI001BE891CD|nr:helix-turn-helix domain-containing protein [Streptomyces sp. ISL-10]MBT2364173.1 helix-turn-helix domain-containing protein [Streptomyces sp. ISL-10]
MYQERPSRLDGCVSWTRTADRRDGPVHLVHPVLPDGCMDLLWNEGRLLVAGPDTTAYHPGGGAGEAWAGLRFAPGAAPAFFGVRAQELRDRRVELADLWGAAKARALAERVGDATDPAVGLEAVALARAAHTPQPDPLYARIVRHLDAGGTVAAAADAAGLGTRQLHRRSLDAFGYGPKTLARILRLQRALALVRRGVPYAEAALAAGCADQAHLAREMRALAGTTLSAYAASAKRETPMPSGSSTTA